MKKQAKCPLCGRRLFDADQNLSGIIEIKCTQCKQVARIEFKPEPTERKNNKYLYTEPSGV